MAERSVPAAPTIVESEQVQRSAELLEALLSSPDRRRRFRGDPGAVLREHGLGELAAGLDEAGSALTTLELRESRSSLAGVMVAAAAEGIELGHLLEHAAPALAHDTGQEMEHLVDKPRPAAHPAAAHAAAAPVKPAAPGPGRESGAAPSASSAPPAQGIPALAPRRAPHAGQLNASAAPAARAAAPAPQAPAPEAAGGAAAVHGPVQHGGPGEIAVQHAPAHDTGLDYPGDAASPQALAAWMGAHARRAGLPPALPVMAALTESGLHNLNYGDRDSVGFFQMRLGIWDRGAYAGYPTHPELQMRWFIDHALAARAADPALAASPSTWGEWVANIEQPAAAYRGRYQLQLGAAQELLHGSADGSVPLSTAPTPVPAPVPHLPIGRAAVKVALEYIAVPHGGGGPVTDGAALVSDAYGQEGMHLPSVAAELLDVGMPVARHALHPGDAVFFTQPDGGHRVGLYVGDGRFVSIPREGGHAKILSMGDRANAGEYAGARRYTPAALADPSRFARTLPTVGR